MLLGILDVNIITMIKVNPIDYLYYKLNRWLSYLTISGNPTQGITVPCLVLGLNILSMLNVISEVTDELRITISATFSICMGFYYAYKHEIIIAKYEMESVKASSKGTKVVILYIIFTIAFLYVSENYF